MTDELPDPDPWEHEAIPAGIDARRIYDYAITVGGSRRRRRLQRRRAIVVGVSCVLAVVIASGILASHTNPHDSVTIAETPVAKPPVPPGADHGKVGKGTTPVPTSAPCQLIVFHEKRPPGVGKPPKTTTSSSPSTTPVTTATTAPTTATTAAPPTTPTTVASQTPTTVRRTPTTVVRKTPTTVKHGRHHPPTTIAVKGSSDNPTISNPGAPPTQPVSLTGAQPPRGVDFRGSAAAPPAALHCR